MTTPAPTEGRGLTGERYLHELLPDYLHEAGVGS